MKAINVQSGKIVGGRNVAFVLASQIDRSKHAVTTRMQSKTLSDFANHGLDQTSPAFWVADDSPVKRHTDMKAKMKWIVIIFVSAVLTTATIAKDTALWDGTCHNVTHQLDRIPETAHSTGWHSNIRVHFHQWLAYWERGDQWEARRKHNFFR